VDGQAAVWFEDYTEGDRVLSPRRHIGVDDIKAYVRFSNDVQTLLHPADDGPLVVPPLYLFSLGVGLLLHGTGTYIPRQFVAFFGFDAIEFHDEARAGDTIRSSATVTELTDRGRNGLVHYLHETRDGNDRLLVSSRQRILVRRKAAADE
jgi:hypothetical protein